MNRKRNLWILIGLMILMAVLVSGFVLIQRTAKDVLVQTLEMAKTITDGHAVVAIDVDTIEQDVNVTIEVWARNGEDGPGAFRLEVLDTSEDKAQGAIIVSDGETLWAYSPSENKVFVGTSDEARALLEENEFMTSEFGQFLESKEVKLDSSDYEHPENAEEAVQKLLEYFKAGKSDDATIAGENTYLLKMEPIAEKMPAEFVAVGGFINLWIGQDSNIPLAMAYTGGSFGELHATVMEYEVNTGINEARFTFEVPNGTEVVTFADLEPRSVSLEEASESVEFEFLTPADTPAGTTLVDILEVSGTLVQRYTLPEGGSFTIAQGLSGENYDEARTQSAKSQTVEVRDTSGQVFEDSEAGRVLLTWTEGNLFYSVAGDLSLDQALSIAESLQ